MHDNEANLKPSSELSTLPEILDCVLNKHRNDPTRLVQILREVQDALGWLPPESLSEVAAKLGISRARVQSTASFYSFFHVRPLGDYRILFSDNITDRMLGSTVLMQSLCQKLWVEPGHVSEDGLVSVDTTSCTGLCDQGPAALVNYRAVSNLTAHRVEHLAELVRGRVPLDAWPSEWFQIEDHLRRRDVLLNSHLSRGAATAAAIDKGGEEVLHQLEISGLRGRGGAGFATAAKWRACREASADTRYVVCNADEGEPGTFKDRVLLTSYFDLLIDGMCIAAFAVRAAKGLIYLRGEYRYLLQSLEERLEQRRREGLLGSNVAGRGLNFDVEIHLGAGAYICGEESALLESLEGKPGKPRIRPPFPVTHGYLGQPTVVNNVETFALAALVSFHGGMWLRQRGTEVSTGTKLLSVSGDVSRPGIYEYPFGVSIAQVLEDSGAYHTQMVTTAGAAGPCLSPQEFGRRIGFEDVPTGGSIMVFNQSRDVFEVARNFAHFFAHESCGFCTPCRVGTAINKRIVDKLAAHRGSPYDLREITNMHRLMQGASHCGLGNTASTALIDLTLKFPEAFRRRLASAEFEPSFDLDASLAQARRMTGRSDGAAHLSENRNSHAYHSALGELK